MWKISHPRLHPYALIQTASSISGLASGRSASKGPNLDIEQIGDAMVVHNYGHGGSGWSLSWGSADIAVQKAMSLSPKEIAVIGCGIIGLTAAIIAQRAGAQVTIYTREMYNRTRSVRANGSWTPDSRVSLTEPAGPQFGALWERMARYSYKTLSLLHGPSRPADRFCRPIPSVGHAIRAPRGKARPTYHGKLCCRPACRSRILNSAATRTVSGISLAAPQILPEGATPFPVKYVARSEIMFFNFGAYGHLLLSEFFGAGGKVVIREFHKPSDLGELKEKVVINCPGYAAKDMWKDKYMIPVRGQTAWLIPQPEVNYGLSYKGTSMLSKSDGIMVMHPPGPAKGDMVGVGDSNEVESREEAEAGVREIEQLYARFPTPA